MAVIRIAVAGKSGQVAQALLRQATGSGVDVIVRGRPELDLTSIDSVGQFIFETRSAVLINATAYTAVDKAETEAEAAFAVNAGAPALLATLCAHFKIPLIHLSTDYVFDGTSTTRYREDDPIAPLGIYGASKAAGEAAIRRSLAQHIIVRTAWVYSRDGANFVRTMLRLGAERDVVRVVADQRGSPTSADEIAAALLSIARQVANGARDDAWGTYHLTGRGETTWHGFAAELFQQTAQRGLKSPRLEAITTADYPTPARRPAYSCLDNSKIERTFGIEREPWQESLEAVIDHLVPQSEGTRA
ncbi:MAG: dTDP-4-dehydrorhamnose reductase [Hyphomicrobium sp.]